MSKKNRNKTNNPKWTYMFDTYQKKYNEVDEIPINNNRIVIITIIMCVVLVSLIIIGFFMMKNKANQATQVYETPVVTTLVTTPEPIYPAGVTPVPQKEILSKYSLKLNKYPDLIGWITIPGTKIDYPVVQSKDPQNPHYYLHKAPDKTDSLQGSIFFDTRNNVMYLDRNTILYGHNMKFGTMFGDLDQYKNHYFRETHNTIVFNTLYDEMEWEIINVMITDVSFYYIDTNIYTDEEFVVYMQECLSKSYYENYVEIKPDDIVITLSTCINDIPDGRLVVQARLKKDVN